ncbi:hypothetical protein NQ317_016711 [Molorchus minor]|uniref:Spectrin repeat-containing domain protein n=1 Tax=Molorchus minor TaxID=1323400 RepID=A0ABQ9J5T4_9CUCU|nr:hypothetical protein NQ317_016711 [Molorchus minor]
MLEKKTQSLQTEVDNHEPRINTVCNNGQKLIDEGHEDAAEFSGLISELHKAWQELKDAIEKATRRSVAQRARPAVSVRRQRSRELDERARALHDGGGSRQGRNLR